jgi:dipeptidyl aminopeptidase/acylaminoacyl peptidase
MESLVMLTYRTFVLATMLLAGLPGFAAGASMSPPAAVFGALPVESMAVLSPDGHWMAWLDHHEPKPRVIMFDVRERKIQRILAVPEKAKLRSLRWHDNETLLIVLSSSTLWEHREISANEHFRVIAHDVSGGDGRILPMRRNPPGYKQTVTLPPLAILLSAHTAKPHTVIMETFGQCHSLFGPCLEEVDTGTGEATVLKVGSKHTQGWIVDRDGVPVAREDWDWHQHAYRVYALRPDDSLLEILRSDDAQRPQLAGLLADGSALVVLAFNGRANRAAWALALDGTPMKLLYESPQGDVTNVWYDPYNGGIAGVYVSGSAGEMHWFDAAAGRRYESVKKAFGARNVLVYGWTADGSKTLARVDGADLPPSYYLIDFATHRADIAAEEYPALAGASLGTTQTITYPARDGMSIPAYLTLPPGHAQGPLPMVVLPHDGPHWRDDTSFDWLVQFLATRGYAVLRPQFRGSEGFGQAFLEAGFREWGGRMQDDVSDGVRAMVERGVADPKRACIVGIGYGGYAALAGAAFTPELYACAASINGISDLPALMRAEVPLYYGTTSSALSYWKQHIGEPNDRRLEARSPINGIKSIQAPVLLMYGTADSEVPNAQTQRMSEKLRAAGARVTTIELTGDDHWLSVGETRLRMLEELERFLSGAL